MKSLQSRTVPGSTGSTYSPSRVLYFDLQNAYQGYSTWGMIFATGGSTNVGTYFYLADSGSAPS